MITWATKSVPSINMAKKPTAMNAVIEEEVPNAVHKVLNTRKKVEGPYRRRFTPLDPGKSLNCPPATSLSAGALQVLLRQLCDNKSADGPD